MHRHPESIQTDGERLGGVIETTRDMSRPAVETVFPRPPRPPPQHRTVNLRLGRAVKATITPGAEHDGLVRSRTPTVSKSRPRQPFRRRRGGDHGELRGIWAVGDSRDRPRPRIEHGDGIVQPGLHTLHFDRQGPSLDRGVLLEERHRHPQILSIKGRLECPQIGDVEPLPRQIGLCIGAGFLAAGCIPLRCGFPGLTNGHLLCNDGHLPLSLGSHRKHRDAHDSQNE